MWKRHEALHVTPQSVRPRIKPVGTGGESLSPGAQAIKYEKYEDKYNDDGEGTPEPLSSLRRASRLEPTLTPRISDERSHSRAESVLPLAGPSALGGGMDAVPQNIQPLQQHWGLPPVGATQQTPEPQAFADIVPTSVYYPSGGASLESWINQILTEQSTFPTFDLPAPPPELPATAFLWDQRGAVESPSAQDAGACSRLRNWLMVSCLARCGLASLTLPGQERLTDADRNHDRSDDPMPCRLLGYDRPPDSYSAPADLFIRRVLPASAA